MWVISSESYFLTIFCTLPSICRRLQFWAKAKYDSDRFSEFSPVPFCTIFSSLSERFRPCSELLTLGPMEATTMPKASQIFRRDPWIRQTSGDLEINVVIRRPSSFGSTNGNIDKLRRYPQQRQRLIVRFFAKNLLRAARPTYIIEIFHPSGTFQNQSRKLYRSSLPKPTRTNLKPAPTYSRTCPELFFPEPSGTWPENCIKSSGAYLKWGPNELGCWGKGIALD